MVSLNSEQQGAVDHGRGSLVLSAGAGSGKTSVLVERYLKHLRDGVPVGNLVAVTFTEKAARGMRKRIRDAIRGNIAAAEPGSAEYRRWRLVEQHLETAAIDTIHGYCTSLLRRHALAAKLDPSFEVLDETQSSMLRREAVADALRDLLLNHLSTADDLHELIVLHGWSAIAGAVTDFLAAPDVATWRVFAAKSSDNVAADWAEVAACMMPAIAKEIIDEVAEIHALRRVVPATREGQATLGVVLAELDRFRADPNAVDAEAFNEMAKVGHHTAAKKLYGADNYDAVKAGYVAIRDLIKKSGLRELAAVPLNLAAAAAVSLRLVRVALHVEASYAARKLEAAVLDFQDLLMKARDLLAENAVIRQGMQTETRFLLLDELQDTDPVQMDLVRLLLGDRFRGGGLFAVGDAKQSIYRFRGADVSLFEQLREEMPDESRRQLTHNYRSGTAIIGFVNVLCREWFPAEAPLVAARDDTTPGAVEFLWAAVKEEKPSAEELREAEAAAIAVRIRELIQAGTEPGSIVLLFRALTSVSIYENALRKLEIEYYLLGGRAFFAQQEVYDLANLLGSLENPLDGLAVVGTLRSPFCGLTDDALTAIAQHEDGPWQGLLADSDLVPTAERENVRRARRNLTTWRQSKDSVPIARLLQRIFAESGYDAALLYEPLGQRKLANLWKLQEIARVFDRRGEGLPEFVAHLTELVANQPREEQAATVPEEARHVVRIMSVHQAKGLEFPVVFVPDLGREKRRGRDGVGYWQRDLGAVVKIPGDSDEDEIGYPKWPVDLAARLDDLADAEESLRVLYVACTRAEDQLILSSGVAAAQTIEPAGPWMVALDDAYDLTTGECRGGGEPVAVRVL